MDDTAAPSQHPVLAYVPDMSPDTATVLMCVDEICGRIIATSKLRDPVAFACAYPIAALHNRDAITAAVTMQYGPIGAHGDRSTSRSVLAVVMSDLFFFCLVAQGMALGTATSTVREVHRQVWSAKPRHVAYRTNPSDLQEALARIPGTPVAGDTLPDRGSMDDIEVWRLNDDTPNPVTGYDSYTVIWLMLAEYMVHREREQLRGRDLHIDAALAGGDDLDTVRLHAVPGKHFTSAHGALQHAADELVPGAGSMVPWEYWARDDEGTRWYTGSDIIDYDALSYPDASYYLIDRVGEELARLRAAEKERSW